MYPFVSALYKTYKYIMLKSEHSENIQVSRFIHISGRNHGDRKPSIVCTADFREPGKWGKIGVKLLKRNKLNLHRIPTQTVAPNGAT
ncbi:hypothetical protein GDO78_006409 [Eleutherodactylus coqui]|uniref:Uncharacterized protein n=1 Tax=Eleutherodactylus coqui TaxID=57060 RepID=A0A8J6FN81_ELECQ|nr:hypothetical protein GDO78_006409 [Eleutherodactylus coqui]